MCDKSKQLHGIFNLTSKNNPSAKSNRGGKSNDAQTQFCQEKGSATGTRESNKVKAAHKALCKTE